MAERTHEIWNDLHNPRGVGLVDWEATDISFPGGTGEVDIAEVTDPELGACVELTIEAHPDSFGGGAYLNLANGDYVAIPYLRTRFVFGAATVKHVSGPPLLCNLSIGWWQGGPSSLALDEVADQVVDTDTVRLEGFDEVKFPALAAGTSLVAIFSAVPPGETSVYRIAKAQLVVAPWADIPAYCDGDEPGCEWEGTPHASRSSGTVVAPVPSYGFNDLTHNLASPLMSVGDEMRLTRQLGADRIRVIGGVDHDLLGAGPVDWTEHAIHDVLSAMRQEGLKALYTSGLHLRDPLVNFADLDPGDYADYAADVAALVDLFPDVIEAVEVYNEPNLGVFWNFPDDSVTPDAAKFVAIQAEVYAAVKAAAAECVVVCGGISHRQTSDLVNPFRAIGLTYWLDAMLAAGLEDVTDAIGLHPYGIWGSGPDSPVGDWGSGLWRAINQVRDRTDKPIWATEFGWATTSRAERLKQATAMALTRGMLDRAPDVDGIFVHTAWEAESESSGFGVVRLPAQTFTPAAEVLAA